MEQNDKLKKLRYLATQLPTHLSVTLKDFAQLYLNTPTLRDCDKEFMKMIEEASENGQILMQIKKRGHPEPYINNLIDQELMEEFVNYKPPTHKETSLGEKKNLYEKTAMKRPDYNGLSLLQQMDHAHRAYNIAMNSLEGLMRRETETAVPFSTARQEAMRMEVKRIEGKNKSWLQEMEEIFWGQGVSPYDKPTTGRDSCNGVIVNPGPIQQNSTTYRGTKEQLIQQAIADNNRGMLQLLNSLTNPPGEILEITKTQRGATHPGLIYKVNTNYNGPTGLPIPTGGLPTLQQMQAGNKSRKRDHGEPQDPADVPVLWFDDNYIIHPTI